MWVARDKNGSIWLYRRMPYRKDDFYWSVDEDDYIQLDNESFPDLKWEDEPIEVEIVKAMEE